MIVAKQPSILVRLLHSIPHLNITLDSVNSTFDPKSVIYKEVRFTKYLESLQLYTYKS